MTTPEKSKQELIEALQGVIEKLKAMDDDQHFGLLLSLGIQKEVGSERFSTTSILVGRQYVITNNLVSEINEDEDYRQLLADILNNLD